MKKLAIAFLIGASLTLPAMAETPDGTEKAAKELAAQLEADQTDEIKIAAENERRAKEEAVRRMHDTEQLREMDYWQAKVNADYAKQRKVTQELAIAAAKQWEATSDNRLPNSVSVTTGTSGSSVTKTYSNENPLTSSGGASGWLRKYFDWNETKEKDFEADRLEEEKHRNSMQEQMSARVHQDSNPPSMTMPSSDSDETIRAFLTAQGYKNLSQADIDGVRAILMRHGLHHINELPQ